MKPQETIEKVELCIIVATIIAITFSHAFLPNKYSVGGLAVCLALTLLVQGLLRDIYLLYKIKKHPENKPKVALRCMCLESTIGLPVVILGVFTAILLPNWQIHISHMYSVMLYSTVLICGYLIKDIIITWRPLGLRREKNHSHIQFRL